MTFEGYDALDRSWDRETKGGGGGGWSE